MTPNQLWQEAAEIRRLASNADSGCWRLRRDADVDHEDWRVFDTRHVHNIIAIADDPDDGAHIAHMSPARALWLASALELLADFGDYRHHGGHCSALLATGECDCGVWALDQRLATLGGSDAR